MAAPANDDWENATELDPLTNLVVGSTAEATTDHDENWLSKNVWYSYAAPADGILEYSLDDDLYLNIWDGENVRSLVQRGRYSVVGGSTYFFEIGRWGSSPLLDEIYEFRLNRIEGGDAVMAEAPSITGVDVAADSVTIHWTETPGALGYTIHRRYSPVQGDYSNPREWASFTAAADATSLTDSSANPGDLYAYYVSSDTPAGSTVWSWGQPAGISPLNDNSDAATSIAASGAWVGGSASTATIDQPAWDADPAARQQWVWYSFTPDFTGDIDIDFQANFTIRGHALYETAADGTYTRISSSSWMADWTRIQTYSIQSGHQYLLAIRSFDRFWFGLTPAGRSGWPRVPAAPTLAMDDGSVRVQWTDNSENETSYSVERQLAGSDQAITLATLPAGSQEYVDASHDYAGAFVNYRVVATSAVGSRASDWTGINIPAANDNWESATALNGDAFTASTSLTASTDQSGEQAPYAATVWYSWQAPTSGRMSWQLQGASHPVMDVYEGDSLPGLVSVLKGTAAASASFTAMAGHRYYLQVSGDSGQFTVGATLIPAEPLAAPVITKVLDYGFSKFSIVWQDNNADESGYLVEFVTSEKAWAQATTTFLPRNTIFCLIDTTPDSAMQPVRVRLRALGGYADSEPVFLTHAVVLPPPVTNFIAGPIDSTSGYASWDGTSFLDMPVEVQFRVAGTEQWAVATQYYGGQYRMKFLGEPNTTYELRARRAGGGFETPWTEIVTVSLLPKEVRLPRSTELDSSVLVKWDYDDLPGATFEVWRENLDGTGAVRLGSTSAKQFADDTGRPGTTYTYTVYAVTENGRSPRGYWSSVRAWTSYPWLKVFNGTTGNDRVEIAVRSEPLAGGHQVIVANGVVYSLPTSGWMAFDLRGGNDYLNLPVWLPLVVYGGTGNDTIIGGAAADTLDGGIGDDSITDGSGGNDSLSGRDGNDSLYSGLGNDWVDGGTGDDLLSCYVYDDGDDQLIGGLGKDTIDYSAFIFAVVISQDEIANDGGNAEHDNVHDDIEVIWTGSGDDTVYGGPASNEIRSGAGNDYVDGGEGNDLVLAGDGDDTLDGGTGDDTLRGEAGNDLFTCAALVDGNDEMIGGDGRDTVDYRALSAGVVIRQNDLADDGREGERDNLGSDVEVIWTGSGNDTVYGGSANNEIRSGAGKDMVGAGAGNDVVSSGDGADSVYGGDGNDTINGEGGPDTVFGNFGDDVISGGDGADSVMAGLGADWIDGQADSDRIWGGDGSDTIYGSAGDDYIEGKGKADTLYGGDGNDIMYGQAGNDLIYGNTGDDVIYVDDPAGSLFRDSVYAGAGTDSVKWDARDVVSGKEKDLLG